LIFTRSTLAHASFLAILLCSACGRSDRDTEFQGTAGQSGGRGGQREQNGGQGGRGQGGEDRGQNGHGGNESAGASGDAAGSGDEPATSSAGSGAGGTSGGSGAPATGGSVTSGGSSGSGECAWDPSTTEKCPACDGNGDCAAPSYKYVGSGAVTSSCCGFEWQEATAPGKYSWSEASEYCASLSLLGRGWRLPKIAELFSLVDLSDDSDASPTIDVEAFSDTLREGYWSSSPDGDSGQAAWTLDFSDGASQAIGIDRQPQRVRCIR